MIHRDAVLEALVGVGVLVGAVVTTNEPLFSVGLVLIGIASFIGAYQSWTGNRSRVAQAFRLVVLALATALFILLLVRTEPLDIGGWGSSVVLVARPSP
jgi:hypothetical protein